MKFVLPVVIGIIIGIITGIVIVLLCGNGKCSKENYDGSVHQEIKIRT